MRSPIRGLFLWREIAWQMLYKPTSKPANNYPRSLFLAVSDFTAAGVLVQRLPADERTAHDTDGWQRATTLCDTLTEEELCTQETQVLLHRLFHDERVRLFDAETVRFHCSCSRERTDGMLLGLGADEVNDILDEQGKVEITCEFCDSLYSYDSVDVLALFRGGSSAQAGDGLGESGDATRH